MMMMTWDRADTVSEVVSRCEVGLRGRGNVVFTMKQLGSQGPRPLTRAHYPKRNVRSVLTIVLPQSSITFTTVIRSPLYVDLSYGRC